MAPEVKDEIKTEAQGADTIDDIIEILDTPDVEEDEDSKEEEKEKPKKDDEEPEEDEAAEKIEPEELEFLHVPRKKEILKEFPEIFKKFPGMERALYKEAQYAELFPTMQEAKEAKEELRGLKEVESQILDGNLTNVLKAVKEQNPQGFDQVVNNYITTLREVDEQAYYGVLNFVIDNAIVTAYKTGQEQQDEQLQIAAQLLNKFIHGNYEIRHPQYPRQVQQRDDPREREIEQKQAEFNQRQFSSALTDVTERTENTIKATIDKYIDNNSQMTPYLKDKAVKDVITELNNEIQSDSRFRSVLDNLWAESAGQDYSKESKNKIRNQIINKAKIVLPSIIRRVRADALKNNRPSSMKIKEEREENEEPSEKRTQTNKKPQMPGRKVSTLDFLNQD